MDKVKFPYPDRAPVKTGALFFMAGINLIFRSVSINVKWFKVNSN